LRKIFWKNNVLIDGEDTGGDNNRTIQLYIFSGKVVVKNSGGILREL
jgi:chemotaxis protein CheD